MRAAVGLEDDEEDFSSSLLPLVPSSSEEKASALSRRKSRRVFEIPRVGVKEGRFAESELQRAREVDIKATTVASDAAVDLVKVFSMANEMN